MDEHLFLRIWQALTSAWFWREAGQRLALLVGLLVAARVFLAITQRGVRRALHRRVKDQRITTLVVAVQSLIWYVVIIAVALIGLYILGVPSAHLLTGLGIGGLAFALGMQNMIRDMVSGVALLLEDAMSVGDEVVLNANQFLSGSVIEMGARVVRLRGPDGQMHQIAYSSITSITNLSRRGSA